MINQTYFVDMSVVEILTTTITSPTTAPLLESSTTTLTPKAEAASEAEGSPDSAVPTHIPSMFSTSMSPPLTTPADQEEELFITVAPTIKEEHEDPDDVSATPDDDLESENVPTVEYDPYEHTTESTDTTESTARSYEEPDDEIVIEIRTIQPDVPILDASLSTEPMFAKGSTEETIVDPGITSDLTDTPTESTELTSEEVFIPSESPLTTELHSTTPFPDYFDEIVTQFHVEALPPTRPPQQDLSSSATESTDGTTDIPTDTPFMRNTRPGSEEETTTTTGLPETTNTATETTPQTKDVDTPSDIYKDETTSTAATSASIDVGTSAEDVTTSVRVFDESITLVPEHSGESLHIEFFTSLPMDSTVADKTTTPGTQSIQVTTGIQNESGKTYQQFI